MNDRPRYWRSLAELEDAPGFQEWLHREFPPLASEWHDDVSRRNFLKLMGASFALAGLGGCTKQPIEKIVPYVRQPPEVMPGKALHFATTLTLGGYGFGAIVESHEGRPTKIEGNPSHPASLGATDAFMQAAVLELYDPDRSQAVLNAAHEDTWGRFEEMLFGTLRQEEAKGGGEGIRILSQTVTSPTLSAQLAAFLQRYPGARWHQWEPVNRDNIREGARLAFNKFVEPVYRLDQADVIVSLGADFLGCGPAKLKYAREFSNRRRVSDGAAERVPFNRLYVAEATPTITGASADSRLPIRESDLATASMALCGGSAASNPWFARVAGELAGSKGRCVVIPGEGLPAPVHAAVHGLNARLGATVDYLNPPEAEPVNQMQSLRELVADMSGGRVTLLVILGGNPVFDAPADLEFGEALRRVKLRVHQGLYANETASLCHWHLPESHALESWGDARAFDGTASIIQPLIQPLYETRGHHELLGFMLGDSNPVAYQVVRDYWAAHGLDDMAWARCLREGVIPNTASPSLAGTITSVAVTTPAMPPPPPAAAHGGLEIIFRPDPSIHDGRFANNGWLQELPKPLTTLTWDNAVLIAPATAHRFALEDTEMVELEVEGRKLSGPVMLMPGQAEDCLTLSMGYGCALGRVSDGAGFDVYPLRTSENLHSLQGAALRRTGASRPLAVLHQQHGMHGRDLLRVGTVADFKKDPAFARANKPEPTRDETLYYPDEHRDTGYAWGMSIDLGACIGCNSCVIACVAENNIPVVGKDQVHRGRLMHWIRIDAYYEGRPENPGFHFMPVPCMHCENAPCELVCPVGATLHDHEGLNLQVYNRCVGTRYCSNNCPYKVRRFNFLEYNAVRAPVEKLVHNPEVTVRSRGVMEKCTYCIQRIENVKIDAQNENRRVRDGEIIPACAQACPTSAITFGDINDRGSRVSRLKALPLTYGLLAELNTRPRTTYLARVFNPPEGEVSS